MRGNEQAGGSAGDREGEEEAEIQDYLAIHRDKLIAVVAMLAVVLEDSGVEDHDGTAAAGVAAELRELRNRLTSSQ